jgi:hypothetical protein
MKRIAITFLLLTSSALAQMPSATPAPAVQPAASASTPTAPTTAIASSTAGSIPPPVPPILAVYRFWPEQFVQWIGSELPYSMVELDVDEISGHSIYDLVLTERATQKRIHYSNTPLVVAAVKAQDAEGYLAPDIKFTRPDAQTTGAIYTLNLTLHDGKALEWRFIQGSDVVEQGGGLSAFPASPMPVFAYREQAAVAGEGTAIQIGDVASAAEPWTEVSHPPYFMAWHGAYSLNATTLVLPGGDEKWTIAAAPAALATGAEWKLTTPNGREMDIHAEKVDGSQATLLIEVAPGNVKRIEDASWDGAAWHYNQLRFIPHNGEKLGLTLQFTPSLADKTPSGFDILVGKKKIVAGSATVGPDKQIAITFKSPDWVKAKSLTESITTTNAELTLQANAH